MKRLYILTLCSCCLAIGIFLLRPQAPSTIAAGAGQIVKKEWLVANKNPRTPKNDCRPADQTFLTFPEWYLVFSPEEQASYFARHTATTFPYNSHTAQLWESYGIVNEQIKDNFPPNAGYHLMIWVIGVSTTVEYTIKAWYETTVGRITDTYAVQTEEDALVARYTQAYVDFIKDRPWYEYDFKRQLYHLWTSIPFWGDHWLRKVERRYALSSELLVKYLYAKLIGLGSDAVYDTALPTTAVILDNDSLRYLPRYDKFAAAATMIARQGHRFKEIAGNTSAIIVSVLLPSAKQVTIANTQVLFTQPISSHPAQKRIVLAMPVGALSAVLLEVSKDKNILLEHVFDY